MTARACKQARTWLEQRALGELDGASSAALDLHLQACADCREEQAIWQDLGQAAQTAPLDPLTPLAERRLISGLSPVRPTPQSGSRRVWKIGLAGAAVGAAAVLAVVFGLRFMAEPEPSTPAPLAETVEGPDAADVAPTPLPPPVVQGDSKPSRIGDRLAIRGAADGTALWLRDGAQVQVLRNDSLEAHFRIDGGYVLAEVGANEPGYRFTVDTTTVRAVARGTVFSVEARAGGDDVVRVVEGAVDVSRLESVDMPVPVVSGEQATRDLMYALQANRSAIERDLAFLVTGVLQPALVPRAKGSGVAATPQLSAEVVAPPEKTDAQQAIVEGRLDDAVLLARVQVEDQPDNPQTVETLTMLAQALRRSHRYGPACDVYQELIDTYPGTVAAANGQVAMGQLELSALDRPEDALGQFEGYLAGSPDGMLAAEARLGQIRSLAALGRHQAVIDAVGAYRIDHPQGSALPEVLLFRAEAHRALGAGDAACLDYRAIVESWPAAPQAPTARQGLAGCDGTPDH